MISDLMFIFSACPQPGDSLPAVRPGGGERPEVLQEGLLQVPAETPSDPFIYLADERSLVDIFLLFLVLVNDQ